MSAPDSPSSSCDETHSRASGPFGQLVISDGRVATHTPRLVSYLKFPTTENRTSCASVREPVLYVYVRICSDGDATLPAFPPHLDSSSPDLQGGMNRKSKSAAIRRLPSSDATAARPFGLLLRIAVVCACFRPWRLLTGGFPFLLLGRGLFQEKLDLSGWFGWSAPLGPVDAICRRRFSVRCPLRRC